MLDSLLSYNDNKIEFFNLLVLVFWKLSFPIKRNCLEDVSACCCKLIIIIFKKEEQFVL